MVDPRERTALLRRAGDQQALAEYVEKRCRPLLGSRVFVDSDGWIFYWTWRSLPKEGLLPNEFTLISPKSKSADIYAPYTRYPWRSHEVVHEVKKDGGSVEAAIRNMDHILTGTRKKERDRVQAVQERSSHLFDLFSTEFTNLTDEQLAAARAETYTLLRRVNLDPDTLMDSLLKEMTGYLLKGSAGRDSLGRINKIITAGALMRAKRLALMRLKGLNEATGKFAQAREALIITREFNRELLSDVAERTKPEHMPALSLFQHPSDTARDMPYVFGAINTMIFQLEQTNIRPYIAVARRVLFDLGKIQELLTQDQRDEIMKQNLFQRVHDPISETLANPLYQYPKPMVDEKPTI